MKILFSQSLFEVWPIIMLLFMLFIAAIFFYVIWLAIKALRKYLKEDTKPKD
jgi:uncharacterized protein YneF (UPF0154 family)